MKASMLAPVKVRERKKRSGTIGRSVCDSTQMKTRQDDRCGHEASQDQRVGPAALAGLDQPPGQRGDRAGDQHRAGDVGRDRARRHRVDSRTTAWVTKQRDDADRHVDQEDPVPGGVLDQRAADDRAQRDAGDRDRAPDADRLAALFRREGAEISESESGMMNAAPRPCSARIAISISMFCENAADERGRR